MFDTAVVSTATQALVDAMEAASGLTDPARVDAIRGLEELVCVATAAQAALAIELDASQRAEQAAAGVPAERQGRGVAAQVALARRESHHRGQQHLGLAKIVASELPCTWRAWRQGRVTEWKATLVARETAFLSREDRAAVDVGVAGDPVRLARMGIASSPPPAGRRPTGSTRRATSSGGAARRSNATCPSDRPRTR